MRPSLIEDSASDAAPTAAPPPVGHNGGPPLELEKEAKTMKAREVARLLGIGLNQVYNAADAGQLPCIRIGGRVLFVRAAIEQMLSADSQPRAA